MDDLFTALVQNSSDAIVLLNADGALRFASESSERLLGYALNERLGRSGFELMHPDDVEHVRAAFGDCLQRAGVPVSAECRMRHRNGTWRNIEATVVNRIGEPGVDAVVINYRDVTDRRHAEHALRDSEERLRHIVEHAQDLIYYCDMEGRFTFVNPAAARVMKYDEQELIGRHFLTLIRPDYRAEAAALYRRQMQDGTPNTYFEFPCVTKDGSLVWVGQHVQLVREGVRLMGVHAIARDITERKDAEERLRTSEARYRSLIEGATYGIFRTTLDGTILDANPALATMLGYDSPEELRSLNMSAIDREPTGRGALIPREQAPDGREVSTDVTWQRKDGSPVMVHLSARVVDFGDGRMCFEGIAEDITERRALEEQLRQAQKMEAVGLLARGVAHDFNNVLAAILGSSDLLTIHLKPGDPAREDAEEIRQAAERGASLTRQLLAFSRNQVLEPHTLDLSAIVREREHMLQRLAGSGVMLRVHADDGHVLVRVEPGQLEQVLLNLVANARDAMPEGGTIEVNVNEVTVDESTAARYPGIPGGVYGRIAVRDTGVGIAPDMQAHVFEPFFTTKGPSRGTGLGLSIVYGIAKDAGGTVVFSTTPGHGTTFEVVLPKVVAR